MHLTTVQIVDVILLIAALLCLPSWPYSKPWGYEPSIVFLIVAVLILVI